MASILPFIRPRADFDDKTTRVVGEAFDAACKELHDTGLPALVYEIIAKRIIAAAKTIGRDAGRVIRAARSA